MPLHVAGTEVYVHTLATLQKRDRHEVAVITPYINHYKPGGIKQHYVYERIDVYQYLETSDPMDKDFIYGKKKPEGLSNFVELITSLQPDIIHFHELNRSIGLGVEHIKLAKFSGAKVVLTMHLSSLTCNTNTLVNHNKLCKGEILEFECTQCTYREKFNMPTLLSIPAAIAANISVQMGIFSLLLKGKAKTLFTMPLAIRRIKTELKELSINVDRFVSLTQWYKTILLENGVPSGKVVVIDQALATFRNEQASAKKSTPFQIPLRIVFLGRIQPQKGIHLLIEALHHFTPKQVCLDIYGQAEDTEYYRQCIKDSTSNELITWKGLLEREDVVDTLRTYDILCLPSTFSEMSPLVIQEAFAAGIPVLASQVYGNMEQIQHGHNGLLFEFKSIASLKDNIQLLIDEPLLLEKMKVVEVAPTSFEAVNEAYSQLYLSI